MTELTTQILYRSKRHPIYWLLLVLLCLFGYQIYLDIQDVVAELNNEKSELIKKVPGITILLFFIAYTVIFTFKKIPGITITNNGIIINGSYFPFVVVESISYLRQPFKFLIVAKQQQSIVIRLRSGEQLTIWKDHYWNGRKIKPLIESQLKQINKSV